MFYKYRDITNVEFLLDIFLKNRLYGAELVSLNDPMEGHFIYNNSGNMSFRKNIIKEIREYYICSLSKRFNKGLMWSHYGGQHKGICIGFDVTASSWKHLEVKYVNSLPRVDTIGQTQIEECLISKSIDWSYEEEVRYIKRIEPKKSRYLSIHIKEVILGLKMPTYYQGLIKSLVDMINKSRKDNDKIKIWKIKTKDIDYGF